MSSFANHSNGNAGGGESKPKKSRNRRKNRNKGGAANSSGAGEGGSLKRSSPQNAGDSKPKKRRNRRKNRNKGGAGDSNGNQTKQGAPQSQPKQGAPQSQPTPVVNNPNSRTSSTTRAAMGSARFDQLAVCQPIKDAIANVLGYEVMTKCQELSIPVSVDGGDVLVKAKTGTGKTLGFLIPAIHRVHETVSFQARQGKTSVLIISPTRELACQIEAEAKQLLTYLKISLQCCYGGTNVKTDLRRFRQFNFPDILVGTPGRLNDHLENNGLASALRGGGLRCLIFDEADQLLEMGFRPEITRMLNMLPPKAERQTLLFSATMPKDILNMSKFALRSDFKHVDCVGKEDQGTHKRVPQFATVYKFDEQFIQLAHAVEEGKKIPGYKIIVFFVTARLTQLNAELFNLMGENVLEIHSRKSQSARTKVSTKFRNGHGMIMFTSDVTARGMDYPDVSMVIQVGIPSDKAQYIHRLGRTARAGKGGCGILLLADFERHFLNECRDQPMQMRPAIAGPAMEAVKSSVAGALYNLPTKTCTMGYQAWLGYYNSNLKRLRWNKNLLVEHANMFAKGCLMLPESPALLAKTVGKMGLRGMPGLRVEGRNGVPRSENNRW